MNYNELQKTHFCQTIKPTPYAIEELVKTIHDYCGTVGKPRIHIKGNDASVSFGLNGGDIVENHPCYNYCNYKLECTIAALRRLADAQWRLMQAKAEYEFQQKNGLDKN